MYPCSHLHDNHPDGFWMDKLISDMAVFIDGPSQSFYGNFMLLRCEYVKFLHGFNGKSVPKTESELICGKRETKVEACDGNSQTLGTI